MGERAAGTKLSESFEKVLYACAYCTDSQGSFIVGGKNISFEGPKTKLQLIRGNRGPFIEVMCRMNDFLIRVLLELS